MGVFGVGYWIGIVLLLEVCFGAEPFANFELEFNYITASPLGVPQQIIAVNGKFPGPVVNVTTNDDVLVNVKNKLNEDLLVTWPGIQMRRSSWQDGVKGTNCPIPSNWNWTYQFQVKDQIGSFFYFPSLHLQRASGGFGPFVIMNRDIIPIPFDTPDGDIVIMIGDWYTRNHTALWQALDDGKELGIPDGVLINGKGPYRYNTSLVPDSIEYETINVKPGKTYRIQVHNIGVSTSLNFRIQNHKLRLVETEGYYTSQQNYTSLDIHVGQSYTFLVTMDQNASSDYYIVASARFVNELWQRVTGVAILHYSNSKGPASGPLPDPPNDFYDKAYSMNQALSIRQNTTASGARPNPQGSFHYGSINVTDVYILRSSQPKLVDGKLLAAYNGISFVNPDTPIRLSDVYKVKGDYKLDFPTMPRDGAPIVDRSIINGTYKGFVEIILQNNDTVLQTFHLDGYSFFVVGMGLEEWTESHRDSYNKWDAISRSTVQIFPGGWTAVYVYFDNVGAWNLRSGSLDRWYLGQETYVRITNPDDPFNKTELPVPENALYCGALSHLQKPQKNSSWTTLHVQSQLYAVLLMVFSSLIAIFS
ncbi:monocopper oxidase-like protein SKU5 [Andrographis paniculata]|uniref:monocopper oxidase-like protein SKU5 n=1 Tax=Andrographis paniculata TaxID=175694 RepID=UPI0021E80F54|nr:monocopper oxidase-like protein SKU5 [Andrographis paniculata]